MLGDTTQGGGCCGNWEIPQCAPPNARAWYKGGNWGTTYYVYCTYSNAACPAGQTRYAPFGQCEITHNDKKNKGKPLCGQTAGNPINTANGTKFQEEVDFPETGASPLNFVRYYTSNFIFEVTTMGPNWRHNYLRTVIVNSATQVTVIRQDGKEYVFNWIGDTWTPEADINEQLIALLDSNGTRTGWQLTTDGRSIETYDNAGKLMAIKDSIGRTLTLTYSDNSTPAAIAPGPGFLIKISDDFNRSLSLTYTTVWRYYFVNTLTDPAGNVYRYSYENTNRNLKTVTYPDNTPGNLTDNAKRTYLYGSETGEAAYSLSPVRAHTLTGIIDENGNRYATYRYDANGKAVSTEHATGGIDRYSLGYASDGSSATVTDPLGTLRTTHFTSILGVVKSTGSDQSAGSGCAASASNLGYDANGNIASRTDFNGNLGCYSYDLNRNLETVRVEGLTSGSSCPADLAAYTPSGDERKTATQWHADYRLPTRIDEAGRRTDFDYDTNGNLLAKTVTDTANGLSRSWTYTYNNLGQVLSADGPRTDVNDVTTYVYYADSAADHKPGDLHTVTNALGHVTTFTAYDANGRLLSLTDPNGLVVGFAYDARGRLTHKTVDGHTTQYDYDPVGNLIKVTRPSGVFYSFTYDAAHRLTDIADALGGKIHYTLDAMGNRTREDIIDADGNVVKTQSRVYDPLNRLAQDIGAYNQTTHYEYDANGNLTQITDPNGHASGHQYDTLNRLIRSTDALNGQTDYQYDALDRLTQVTDANNHSTVYSYNGLGDLMQLESPNTGTTQYGYDSAGNVAQKTDAGGVTATYQYDELNRLLGIEYPGAEADVNNGYDGTAQGLSGQIGRLTSARRGDIETRQHFDLRGNLTASTVTDLAGNRTVSDVQYAYDADDQVTETRPMVNLSIENGYDAAGKVRRVQLVETGANGTTAHILADAVQHLPFGPVSDLNYGNGLALHSNYDKAYLLESNIVSGSDIKPQYYIRNPMDNVEFITDHNENLNIDSSKYLFEYDILNRLSMVYDGPFFGRTLNYFYDAVGNRTAQYDSAAGNTNYQYDLNNQQLIKTVNGPTYGSNPQGNIQQIGNRSLHYAADQLLNRVEQNGVTFGSYHYDAFGHRIGKTVATGSTDYAYDLEHQLIAEIRSGSVQHTAYLDGQPLARIDSNGTDNSIVYFLNNHLGSPRLVTDQNRQVVWNAQFDPFGQATVTTSGITQNLRFPGQYYDAETGWHYNFNRYYDPAVGRYLQSDPIGLAGGINTYAYVLNNPLRYIDPLGLAPGDYPPPPPGYSPDNWSTGQWDNGKWNLTDPEGKTYTIHPEDDGHWRHWDIQDSNGKDGGSWPPNSKKPWPGQKKPKANQCPTDPSGDATPWEPPIPSSDNSTPNNSNVPFVPLPEMVPLMRPFVFPMPVPVIP